MANKNNEEIQLQIALETICAHPEFAQITPKDLLNAESFCTVIRNAKFESVVALQDVLEQIAYNTDNANEASGFLLNFLCFAGGLVENSETPCAPSQGTLLTNIQLAKSGFKNIPAEDYDAFYHWAISCEEHERAQAYTAALDALAKRLVRIAPEDSQGRLVHYRIFTLMYYTLTPFDFLLSCGNYSRENFNNSYNPREQIPPNLWQAFNTRPKAHIEKLINKWWGLKAGTPHDFSIALEWQRAGYIQIHKGKNYYTAVGEYLMDSCEPADPDYGPSVKTNSAIEALKLDPWLADDFYHSLTIKDSYSWLISANIPHRANFLKELFSVGALDSHRVISALDMGITNKWDRQGLTFYNQLRSLLTSA